MQRGTHLCVCVLCTCVQRTVHLCVYVECKWVISMCFSTLSQLQRGFSRYFVPRTWCYYIHYGIFIHRKLINTKWEQAKSLAQSCNFVLKLRILFSHMNTFMQMYARVAPPTRLLAYLMVKVVAVMRLFDRSRIYECESHQIERSNRNLVVTFWILIIKLKALYCHILVRRLWIFLHIYLVLTESSIFTNGNNSISLHRSSSMAIDCTALYTVYFSLGIFNKILGISLWRLQFCCVDGRGRIGIRK